MSELMQDPETGIIYRENSFGQLEEVDPKQAELQVSQSQNPVMNAMGAAYDATRKGLADWTSMAPMIPPELEQGLTNYSQQADQSLQARYANNPNAAMIGEWGPLVAGGVAGLAKGGVTMADRIAKGYKNYRKSKVVKAGIVQRMDDAYDIAKEQYKAASPEMKGKASARLRHRGAQKARAHAIVEGEQAVMDTVKNVGLGLGGTAIAGIAADKVFGGD